MTNKETTANVPYRFYKRFCFSCSVVLLFSSAVFLYEVWDIKFVTKYRVKLAEPTWIPTQNKIALVTALTVPNKRTSSEDQFRTSPDVNLASIEVQKASQPKKSKIKRVSKPRASSGDRSLRDVQSASSQVQTGSQAKPDSKGRSSPDVHSASSEVKPRQDSRGLPSSEVHSESSEFQTGKKKRTGSGDRSSPDAHSTSSEVKPRQDSEGRSSSEVHSETSEVQTGLKPNLDSRNRPSPELHPTILSTKMSLDVAPTMQSERRRSLLIYGADRSGTTFITKMFAEDSQLMTVYEPLWITSRWNQEDNSQKPNWTRNVLDLLSAILSCKFAEGPAGVRFLSRTTRQWAGAYVKSPFTSLTFCPNWECKDLSSNPTYADTVCLTKYKHSVTKIGEPRTPRNLISSFLPRLFSENPETDIRVIQLIRDPRASFNSRIKLLWMIDWRHSDFPNRVRTICSNLAVNIKFGRNLGKWQDKYLEVHYHDLAAKPLETTKAMYKFAGFEMPDSIAEWVVRNTSPSKQELFKERDKIFSTVRNSTANIDKWQQESPVERIRIIEEYCKEALDLLGLKKML